MEEKNKIILQVDVYLSKGSNDFTVASEMAKNVSK